MSHPAPTLTGERAASRGRPLPSPVVALPEPGLDLDQDEEWVVVQNGASWRQIRLHDYAEVFSVPGLYEKIVYGICHCSSPVQIRELLAGRLREAGVSAHSLQVLDLGAGNGCVAEELEELGARRFVGVDIHPEARQAATRDRPGLYQEYLVGDLSDPDGPACRALRQERLNCLTCVAALGFGDVPPIVFAHAFNAVDDGGWIAFTIKSEFLRQEDHSGFAAFIRQLLAERLLEAATSKPYVHRQSVDQHPIHYHAFVGRKAGDVDAVLLRSLHSGR